MEACTEQQQQKRHRTLQTKRKRPRSPSASPGRIPYILGLPNDVVHIIFSKLDFKDKVSAGLVCKQWDELLKAAAGALRHWVVDYNLDTCVSKGFDPSRWVLKRVAAIKCVHVTATWGFEERDDATTRVLESQLPLLVNCLFKHGTTLHLAFYGESPFARPLLSSSAFLSFLCPMVKSLSLTDLDTAISASHFAAICELSSLEDLSISRFDYDPIGRQEITSDISKLVNLKALTLECIGAMKDMSFALARLTNLTSLCIRRNDGTCFPPSLQGLKCVTTVDLTECWLESIPEALIGLASLTSLDLSENYFDSGRSEGWPWWPTTLSRLTRLVDLVMFNCRIVSLSPHISALQQLTSLDIGRNKLSYLPLKLSSLQTLRELWANCNHFCTAPVDVFSSLVALTRVSFTSQGFLDYGERYEDFYSGDDEECYSSKYDEEEYYSKAEEDEEEEGEEEEEQEEEEDDDQYIYGPSTFTSLDLSGNSFDTDDSWVRSLRWPGTLSRLTNLGELRISFCEIHTLRPEISELRQLTKLDISDNKVCSLPEGLSRLRKLRDLVADCNSFPTVPVSVLSRVTALTNISLRDQHYKGSETFQVSSSLLPILQAGLVKLDLSQKTQWDRLSHRYLRQAMVEAADKAPNLTVEYVQTRQR